jgi:glycerol uptake facilitator protein
MLGELVGTAILVFFGCGAVAVSVLFAALSGLFQVAAVWGIGVTLAIYATRHICCAHLNPAVSVAMVLAGRMDPRKLLPYLAGQFAGALLAAVVLLGIFSASIAHFETSHGIVRGTPRSVATAMIFGEFYPNPGAAPAATVSISNAVAAEVVGTFALVLLIFCLTEGCNVGRPDHTLTPVFIGLTVTVIICVIAPLTQAGLNPARDLSPRLLACLAGWGGAAFPDPPLAAPLVYGLGPVLGGVLAAGFFAGILAPVMTWTNAAARCSCSAVEPDPGVERYGRRSARI